MRLCDRGVRSGRIWETAGAGSILAVAAIAAVLSLAAMLLPLFTVLSARSAASSAADAAALAAADIAIGILPGVPCVAAGAVAAENGATLTDCDSDGAVVTVRVFVSVLGLQVAARATAGPPGAEPN